MLPTLPAAAQDTHLIVITGVGGDEAHSTQFHKWASAVVDGVKKRGLPDANVIYLSERPDQDTARIRGRSSRDEVSKTLIGVGARANANDEIFILLIGHGSFDGKTAAFNLPGPDLTAEDYAGLLSKMKAQRIVFVNTASSSGAFLQPLKGPGRTIVAATRTGGERNETRFPGFFVEALETEEADRDRNGRVSVFEAFEFARQKVATSYEQGGHILTEHATLDDGAEGKLASTQFLAPPRSRSVEMAGASPELKGLVAEREAIERKVEDLRLRKDAMDAASYEKQLEQLLTELALKTRAIRDLEAKK
jgi:Peptidase C13 family